MAARSAFNEDDQIKFLLSCVRHSNYGQVDFAKVVEECQIISMGAASKRLSRLFKKYPATGTADSSGSVVTPQPSPKSKPKSKPKPVTAEPKAPEQKGGRSGKGSIKAGAPQKSSAGPVFGGITKKSAGRTKCKGVKVEGAPDTDEIYDADVDLETETPNLGDFIDTDA